MERENIGGKDVTEEYSDLGAQLVNLEATQIELRELLTDARQKTQKAEDVLKVYQELTKVRGEIERVKGRMQYLGNLAALGDRYHRADPRHPGQAGRRTGLAAAGDTQRRALTGQRAQGTG